MDIMATRTMEGYGEAAHIFVREEDERRMAHSRKYQAKLVAPDGGEANECGCVYKDTAIVSAPGDGDNVGSAHIFVRDKVSPDGTTNDYFGNYVDIYIYIYMRIL